MSKLSQAVSLHPYFDVREGNLEAFLALMPEFVAKTADEPACLYYDFTRLGNRCACREAYVGAAGILAHLENVGELLGKFLELADLARLEIHGPAGELEALREPLAHLNAEFFVWECGLETT
jgi:quinol monooxygenase YgiN